MRRRSPLLLAAASAAIAAAGISLPGGRAAAGCLAPTDAVIDAGGTVGPFWGNEQGSLLYSRNLTGAKVELIRRRTGELGQPIAVQGERNEFFVGLSRETWEGFHGGTVNSDDDLAFVASTSADDDPTTSINESLAFRGVYAARGNSLFEIARFGQPSPVKDPFGAPVPWASFFDAAALARTPAGRLEVAFSGQLGAPDGRIGFFRWSEETFEVEPVLLSGDPAPSGGTFRTMGRARANEVGDIAFLGVTELTEGGAAIPGLYIAHSSGVTSRVVTFGVDGDDAPGGGRLGVLGDFDVDDQGGVIFAATLTGGGAESGLYRAAPPFYSPQVVVLEGEATPLGGTYGTFSTAAVRLNGDGEAALSVAVSDDVGGFGLFVFPAAGGEPLALANPDRVLTLAAIGSGRVGYQTQKETRAVVPADGTEEGPTDFRVVKLDLRNSAPSNSDVLVLDGSFRLPAWDAVPPAVFPGEGVLRRTPEEELSGAELTRLVEVRLSVSTGPGNEFVFGIGGTDADPIGSVRVNGTAATLRRLVLRDGTTATWKFRSAVGTGSLTVDLDEGSFRLRVSRGNLAPSFEAPNFRVAFTLRSAADVQGDAPLDGSFFHHDVRLDADQPRFAGGRRVRSRGERIEGGTLFVDQVRVVRKLKTRKGQAAPDVQDDAVALDGTLRICPGSEAPRTPTLDARLVLGSLDLPDLVLRRKGKGSRYAYRSPKGAAPKVALDVDVAAGRFRLRAKGVPPLPELEDADFSGAHPTNDAQLEVGGMELPFELFVERVYEADYLLPVVRRKGGRVFD